MWVGTTLVQSRIFETHKIVKLVLHHPDYNLLKVYEKMEDGSLETYRRNIISVTCEALKNSVPVWWSQRPMVGMVIANAEQEKDDIKWARIDDFLPYFRPNDSPSYVVFKSQYPKLFNRIENAFNSIINESNTTTKVTWEILREAGWTEPTST